MAGSMTERHGFRQRFRDSSIGAMLHRIRHRSRSSTRLDAVDLASKPDVDPKVFTAKGESSPQEPVIASDAHEITPRISSDAPLLDIHVVAQPEAKEDIIAPTVESPESSDIWSAAYREAVDHLGKDINRAILEGDSVAELFAQLEKMEKDASQESLFLKGVKYLRSIQVPLEKFKLALDLASPLTSIEPTTAAVFSVVRGATAMAIALSTADLPFAQQMGEMLKYLSYIDDCDTLGQETDKQDIHKALVLVYLKLLEFYSTAFDILSEKGVKLVVGVVLEKGHLPSIVSDFLGHTKYLQELVLKATAEIAQDIKVMVYDREIATWLGNGTLSRQIERGIELGKFRSDQACTFLLAHPEFIRWYHATGSPELVILGQMGSGKSVAMGFLIDELRKRSEHQLLQPKICYHYCQNDATDKPIYILSTLVLSLLEQLPGLKKTFVKWYQQRVISGNESTMGSAKNFDGLEVWLRGVLETIDRPIIFAIDGLDECDKQSRKAIISSLRNMSASSSQRATGLRLLFSSRPEDDILKLLKGASQMTILPDCTRDRLIVKSAVESRLDHLSQDVQALIIDTLSSQAQGSAIWTSMTVNLIKTAPIESIDPMKRYLAKMPQPQELSDVYATLFSRKTDNNPDSQKLATTALEFLAVSRRPLSILELCWAVKLSSALDEEAITTVGDLMPLVDPGPIMRLIQPLVAAVDFGDMTKRQLKLVHQSAKDFIKQRAVLTTMTSIGGQMISQQRIESIEARILDICLQYLLLRDINDTDLFTSNQLETQELPLDANLFSDDDDNLDDNNPNSDSAQLETGNWEEMIPHYDPSDKFGHFFVYASCYWTDHLTAIKSTESWKLLEDIQLVCQAGSTRLRNWTEQNSRPDCTITPRFEWDLTKYDPLVITTIYGSDALFQNMLANSDLDNKEAFLANSGMQAADRILQCGGDLTRLELLWTSSKTAHQLRAFSFFSLIVNQWSSSPSERLRAGWDGVFDLVNDSEMLDTMIAEQWGNRIFCIAAKKGCMPMVRRLVERAKIHEGLRAELLAHRPTYAGAIGEAVLGNQAEVVEYLLEQPEFEAQIYDFRTENKENVLHLASKHVADKLCNPAIFELLVPRLGKISNGDMFYEADAWDETALTRIILSTAYTENRVKSARILLNEMAATSGNGTDGSLRLEKEKQKALQLAIRLGDMELELRNVLISFGAVAA